MQFAFSHLNFIQNGITVSANSSLEIRHSARPVSSTSRGKKREVYFKKILKYETWSRMKATATILAVLKKLT